MSTELEYVPYSEFVAGLSTTENPTSADKTVISNPTNGPRAVPGSAAGITTAATEADLVAGSSVTIQTAEGLKKLPGDQIAPRSVQEKNTRNLVPLTYKNIASGDLEKHNASLGYNGWYYPNQVETKHVSIALYKGMQLVLSNTGINAFYAFFPASFLDKDFSNNDSFPVGVSRAVLNAGESLKKDIDSDCVLVLNIVDGGNNANDWDIVVKNSEELKTDLLANPSFSSSALVENNASLASTSWYFSGQFEKHVSVKLFGGSRLVLKNTSNTVSAYAIMPKTFADGSFANGVPFPTGVSRVVVNAGEEISIDVSDDCVLVMTSVDPSNTIITWSVNVLYGNYFVIKNELNDIVDGFTKTIATTSLKYYKGSLGGGAWNLLNDTARHCSVKLLAGQSVTLENTGAIDAFYAFFPSSYSDSDKTNGEAYSAGYSGRIFLEHGESADISPEVDCVLVMNAVDGGNNANSFSIGITQTPLFELINEKTGIATDIKTSYDSSNLTAYKASLGNGVWFMPSPGANPRHCSITCNVGQYLELTNTGVIDAFYALFPASFVDGDMTGGADFPAGYNRIVLGAGKTIKITILEDSVLVMNAVDGGNNANSFHADVFDLSSDKINLKSSTQFCRLKVAEWNVGHFAMGASGDTTIPPEQKDEKQAEYRSLINSIGADVLILCENSVDFCTDGTKANDSVWNCFKQINDGPKNGYNMNSVLTNGMLLVSKKINYYVNQDLNLGRYFIDCQYCIKGREVHIIATHNTWGDKTTAMAQYNELITYCADFDNVILAADFNAGSQWNYGMADVVAPLFHTAGFSSAWCDYMGAVDTYPDSQYQPANLDNIFVKGFSVTNSQVIDSSIDLSDHKMITCDLVME